MNHVLYTYFIVCIYNKDQAVYVKVIFTTIFSFDIFIVFFYLPEASKLKITRKISS